MSPSRISSLVILTACAAAREGARKLIDRQIPRRADEVVNEDEVPARSPRSFRPQRIRN